MPLRGIQTREIKEAHLRNLIDGQLPEGKTVDYKQELPASSDGAKKDFLADLCSFANAAGGYIIFGMPESDGLPLDLTGVAGDVDAAVLRMESMARDGIRPPIPGLEFVRVALANGANAVVASIPKSWNAPHQVVFQKDFRFYTRGSAGKQHIDVDELRRIVLLSQEAGERIRQFRAGRIAAVLSGETPVVLQPGARQILHLVPLNAFSAGAAVNLAALDKKKGLLVGAMDRGGSQRHNVDGLLAYSASGQSHDGYAQLFRNGILETVVHQLERKARGRLLLPSLAFEESIFKQMSVAIEVLKAVSVAPPVAVMLSFTGIKGWEMGVRDDWGTRGSRGGFDREPLLIPEMIFETLEIDNVPKAIKPIVDSTWNAAGFPESDYYAQNGNWIGEPGR
jgi:hypothetical protein